MKKLLFVLFIVAFAAFATLASQKTKLFAITGDTTSTTITFADAASKQLVIDAICKRGSFNPANEKGQTAEEFFNSELAQILSDAVYQHRVGTAVENAVKIVPKDDLPTKEAAAIKPIKK